MSVIIHHQHRWIDTPVLVVALDGWVDAGLAATGAVAHLLSLTRTEPVASFDTEETVDYRSRRPIAKIVDGVTEEIRWPSTEVLVGTDAAGSDVCYLVGAEPDLRWKSFVRAVAELAVELRVRMAVGLGAFPAAAPHTRPVKLASTVPYQSHELGRRVGIVQGTLEVPTGIWGALEEALGNAGIDAIGLWARVPHYVAGMPFPAASAALVDGLVALSGLAFDSTPLHTAADTSLSQVDKLISRSREHEQMVRQLERNIDAVEGNPLDMGHVPTGDEIAAELERYLREEGGPAQG
jgi:hypothetical protein